MSIAGTPYGEAIAIAVGATGSWDFSAQPGTNISVSVMPDGTITAYECLYRMTVDGSAPGAAISAGAVNGIVAGGGLGMVPQYWEFIDPIDTVKIRNDGNEMGTFCVTVYRDNVRE